MNVKIYLTYLFLLIFSFLLSAQDWASFAQIGDTENESIDDLEAGSNEEVYLCGRFDGILNVDNIQLESIGSADVYLLKLNPDGSPNWASSGGSISFDENGGIAIANENIYWAGMYWIEATFETLELMAEKSSKSIFLVKYSTSGAIENGISIHGTGTKTIQDIQVDLEGSVYLTGNFSDSLFIQDTVIVATAETNLYIMKLDENQELVWITQAGDEGFVLPEALTITADREVIIGGNFQGAITFGSNMIETNTSDDDVFLARFDDNGNAIWGRKAGGVHEQFCSSLTLDESGNIYVGGSMFGVMKLSEALTIQSINLVDNLFLLKYDMDGNAVWGRSIGSLAPELVTDLQYHENKLVLSGYFRDSLKIDNFTTTAPPNLNTSFLAGFNLDGQSEWVEVVKGESQVFLESIAFSNTGSILTAGAFNGTVDFDNETYNTNGFYDVFVGRYDGIFTELDEAAYTNFEVRIFPNPTIDQISLKTNATTFSVTIFDVNGKLILQKENEKRINVSDFLNGVYFIRIDFGEVGLTKTLRFTKVD